jgi:4-hydroxybenzoate polyprenyltransferase
VRLDRVRAPASALALAAHPVPSLAVTVMTVALTAGAGNDAATCVLVGVAVLSGQLSIGWSNDALDAERDQQVGRSDKPVAVGAVSTSTVLTAAFVALPVTVLASFALGWRAALAQLVMVACGWIYNLGVKSTVLSWLPFVPAFAALPAVATLALPDHPWPPWWSLVAGGLIGVSGHLGNVLPDLAQDDVTGVRGLAHRIGPAWTAALGLGSAFAAVVLVALAPGDSVTWWSWLGLAVAAVVTAVAFIVVRRRPSSEAAFYATTTVAAIGVTLLATSPAFP